MLAIAISSRTQRTMPSIAPARPLGLAWPARCFASARPVHHMMKKVNAATTNRKKTCLVIEKLSVSGPR